MRQEVELILLLWSWAVTRAAAIIGAAGVCTYAYMRAGYSPGNEVRGRGYTYSLECVREKKNQSINYLALSVFVLDMPARAL